MDKICFSFNNGVKFGAFMENPFLKLVGNVRIIQKCMENMFPETPKTCSLPLRWNVKCFSFVFWIPFLIRFPFLKPPITNMENVSVKRKMAGSGILPNGSRSQLVPVDSRGGQCKGLLSSWQVHKTMIFSFFTYYLSEF